MENIMRREKVYLDCIKDKLVSDINLNIKINSPRLKTKRTERQKEGRREGEQI